MEITLTFELKLGQEDLEDIVDMAGYAIGYWAQTIREADDGSFVIIDEESQKHSVTASNVEQAIAKILDDTVEVGSSVKRYIMSAVEESDLSHIDSDAADAIMQVLCFNEVIYG